MLFNSLHFLFFFPIVVLIYFIIPNRIKYIWLLIVSYYFYMCWNVKYIVLILFSTIITYSCGILVKKIKGTVYENRKKQHLKKMVVTLSLVLNFLVLFYFKYTNFALSSIQKILRVIHIDISVPTVDIMLPVGISFFIFQAVGYMIDVYRDEIEAEKNF